MKERNVGLTQRIRNKVNTSNLTSVLLLPPLISHSAII